MRHDENGYPADVINSYGCTVTRIWDADDVRELCIENNWYTRGTYGEYESLLKLVYDFPPRYETVYAVAENITAHSDDAELYPAAVAFELERRVVRTFYGPAR